MDTIFIVQKTLFGSKIAPEKFSDGVTGSKMTFCVQKRHSNFDQSTFEHGQNFDALFSARMPIYAR